MLIVWRTSEISRRTEQRWCWDGTCVVIEEGVVHGHVFKGQFCAVDNVLENFLVDEDDGGLFQMVESHQAERLLGFLQGFVHYSLI